jgi:hypothetical protein
MTTTRRTGRKGSADRKEAANIRADLRVLFLTKNSRTAFFEGLLRTACEAHSWRVHTVCQPRTEERWKKVTGARGSYTLVPDFTVATMWERDEAAVAEVDDFIASCEFANGVSAGRILLAGERDLGRGFSHSIYHWFHNRTARRVLRDNTAALPILRRMFAFARESVRNAKPELVVAGEWADPLCFTFYLVARQMGIRCVVNRKSKVWNGRAYWTTDPMMYNLATRALASEKKARNAPVSDRALEHIASFRAAPHTLGYIQKVWNAAERRGWLARHKHLARLFAVQLRHYLDGRGGPEPKSALQLTWAHYRRPWMEWRQRRYFHRFDEKSLKAMPYIFTALHKDPEQALNYQAPFWTYQHNTISLLTTVLPAGFKLLVREHRMNLGRRPTRALEDISRLPGVRLIDAFDDQFKYIANADVIVTDNSTIGSEGLLLGRRVITLSETHYDAEGLAERVRDPENLAGAVVRILQKPAVQNSKAYDEALGRLLDAEWETTASIDEHDYAGNLDLLADLIAEDEHAIPTVKVSA